MEQPRYMAKNWETKIESLRIAGGIILIIPRTKYGTSFVTISAYRLLDLSHLPPISRYCTLFTCICVLQLNTDLAWIHSLENQTTEIKIQMVIYSSIFHREIIFFRQNWNIFIKCELARFFTSPTLDGEFNACRGIRYRFSLRQTFNSPTVSRFVVCKTRNSTPI